MSNYYGDLLHVVRVIESCETWEQYKIARKVHKALNKKWTSSQPNWDDAAYIALDIKCDELEYNLEVDYHGKVLIRGNV